MSQAYIKILFPFSDNKCKDEVYFASQRKKVHTAIYPFKIFIKSSKRKKRLEVCRNFQELHLIYSHFQFTWQFPKLEKERQKKRKKFTFRNSLPKLFYKKAVLKNFARFTGKQLCQSLFFNKVSGLRSATLLRMRLWHRYFPVTFARFLRASFLKNTSNDSFCTLKKYLINYSIFF